MIYEAASRDVTFPPFSERSVERDWDAYHPINLPRWVDRWCSK